MIDVAWFGDARCLDVAVAGGKGASLARMTAEGLPVPPGFVVPATALERCVEVDRLRALARLAALGVELEERFGVPQDVEWALAGGELYLLQSRPVTTL